MIVAVTAKDMNLDSDVDPRFGRCQCFILVETKTKEFEALANKSAQEAGGAGVQAAQTIVRSGAKAVITGNVGPNAFQTLSASGIKVFLNSAGTVTEALEKYEKGELTEPQSPSVGSHHGMGNGGKTQ